MTPGGPAMAEADWRKLATEWFPTLVDHRLRQVSWPLTAAQLTAAQLTAAQQ